MSVLNFMHVKYQACNDMGYDSLYKVAYES